MLPSSIARRSQALREAEGKFVGFSYPLLTVLLYAIDELSLYIHFFYSSD